MADVPNTSQASYYQLKNHIALPKNEVTKALILDAAVQRAAGLGKSIRSLARQLSNLFAAGEKGVLFDPSVVGTLYQTTAMRNPCQPGDPVGMILDQSKWGGASLGELYGPELVTNGGFDTDLAGWSETSAPLTATWSAGRAAIFRSGAINPVEAFGQARSLTIGRTYELSFEFSGNPGAYGILPSVQLGIAAAMGVTRVVFTAVAATQTITFWSADNTTAYLDNVSLREVTVANALAPVLGPELVTNGGFDSDTAWTKGAGWTISGGLLRGATGAFSEAYNSLTTRTGAVYAVTLDITVSSGNVLLYASNGANVSVNTTGRVSVFLIAGSSGNRISIGGQNFIGTIDNVSVKEIPGNHATQATAAKRPTYGIHPFGGRRNLLTYSEDLTHADWNVKSNVTVGAGGEVTNTSTNSFIGRNLSVPSAGPCTLTFKVKAGANTGDYFNVIYNGLAGVGDISAIFDLVSGAVSSTTGNVIADMSGPDANGFYSCFVTVTTTTDLDWVLYTSPSSTGNTRTNVVGDSVFIQSAQLELGATATAYQKVITKYVVTETGVPSVHYLSFDGVDDAMVTPSIDFTSTDEMSVFAGVRKLSDAAVGTVCELSPNLSVGSFILFTPKINGQANYAVHSRGSNSSNSIGTSLSYPAPITNVVAAFADISADTESLRINGVNEGTGAFDQGTGNYGNHPLYVGARGSTSLYYNGHLYALTVRGKTTDAAGIADAEGITAEKTGITL